MSFAQTYSARKAVVDSVEVVRLADSARKIEVTIVPSVGNMAYEMNVNGKNVFWMPSPSLSAFKAKPPMAGNPFLAPWANRIEGDAFWANGKKYVFNLELGNIRRDQNRNPIHGFLTYSPLWEVTAVESNEKYAAVTSRLEFWRYPDFMAQFPFAHTLEMTYRLQDGALEVATRIENFSNEPMPVAVGYHPYFQILDAPRDEWKVHIAAKDHLTLSNALIPTGERTPVSYADQQPLAGIQFDDVFANLVRDADGRAEFSVQGARQKISVIYGPKYTVAVIYAPARRNFICFEPMAAITNGFNLAHSGVYKELQSIPPRGVWQESYWIKPSGF
ncbi:MAG: aldose 1-epimerase [Rhodospirillales bacterium]